MKKAVYLFISIILNVNFAFAESFVIEINNLNMRVSSPERILDPVSVLVKNNTSMKVHAELRSTDKVLKRFVVDGTGGDNSETLQVKLPANHKLYFLTVSPPSQTVELKFKQRPYEIPEKE